MTQPIDVAFVEIRPDTKEFVTHLKKDVDKAAKDTDKSTSSLASRISKSFEGVGETLAETLTGAFKLAGQSASAFGSIITGNVSALGQLAATGPIGIAAVAVALVALAAAATAAAAAIQALVDIALFGVALIPGAISAAIAGFGILAVAVHGVVDAFGEMTKQSNASGAAAVDNSRRIADAQRGVLQAQRALIKAREEERERIQDVNRELVAARTREKRLADDVLKAQFALAEAQRTGTPRAVIEAQLALDEANAALAEGKDRTEDLAKEKARADKVGVEGSDAVLAAQERLKDAQDALAASQQKFSAGAASQATPAFDGLTKSAQAFVLALVAAKKELGPVADAIQEAFFKGTAPLIDPIVENIKELEPELTRVSAAFGGIFKELLKFLGSDEAKDAGKGLLTGLAVFLEKITPSIGPLAEAFGKLIGDSGEFGDSLGGKVADALLGIADFVKTVDLNKLFEDAKTAIQDLTPIVTSLWSIFKSLWSILTTVGNVTLPFIAAHFEFLADVIDVVKMAVDGWKFAFIVAKDWIQKELPKLIDRIKKWFEDLPENIKKIGPKLLEAGKSIIGKLWEGLKSGGGFLADVGKKISNFVIDFLNNNVIGNINRGVNRLEDAINKILPGDGINIPDIPNIPRLAKGGIATDSMLANIGEAGQEAVIPLESQTALNKIGNAIAAAGGLGGGMVFEAGAVMINFNGVVPTEAEAFRTGQAVGSGIMDRIARSRVRTQVRLI